MTTRRMFRIYVLEAKSEILKMLRMPTYFISTLAFPLMFYVFFGIVMNGKAAIGHTSIPAYLLGTYGSFGVIGATMFGFGVGVAVERGLGWLQVKRASPMPPFAYFVAKAVACAFFSLIVVLSLFALGAAFGDVRMPFSKWVLLAVTLTAGTIPFSTLGLAISYFAGPNSAPAVVNAIYLPMAFFSGLWIPIMFLPSAFREAAAAFPAYHFAQIALAVLGAPFRGAVISHIEALVGFSLVFLGVAFLGHRREQEKMYG